MAGRRTIGQILLNFGRITEQDVEAALEHQRSHGGYFGEALVACGAVMREELEWGLASQFDLPYVFPEADSVDPEAASLVSSEWALANLTLPIMKTAESVTVVVESPIDTSAVDELSAKTELDIELALASGPKIRELIRQVYARGSAAEEEGQPMPLELPALFDAAADAGSHHFGISTRGNRSTAWWADAGSVRRRTLHGDWQAVLEDALSPSPSQTLGVEGRAEWKGTLRHAGLAAPVTVSYLADESGHEFLFRPDTEPSPLRDRFPPPPSGVVSEVRLLARSGSARFIVVADPPELGHDILPHVPELLLDPSWRSIYVNAGDQGVAGEVFSVKMPENPDSWAAELKTLRAFHFDVVTADLSGNQEAWTNTALDVASVAFLLWPPDQDTRPAREAGIRWVLSIGRDVDGGLAWALEPLHG